MSTPRRSRTAAAAILVATVAQLAVATFATSLPQFEGKAFGSRLVFYPILMLLTPVVWTIVQRVKGSRSPVPWNGVALIMLPFLIDVTGNTLDLYDRAWWWDDLNHFANWLLLALGIGLMLRRAPQVRGWPSALIVAGFGAILAILWELGEWYSFIRHGTELATAYEDTLGDEALGLLGAIVAAVALLLLDRRAARRSL